MRTEQEIRQELAKQVEYRKTHWNEPEQQKIAGSIISALQWVLTEPISGKLGGKC